MPGRSRIASEEEMRAIARLVGGETPEVVARETGIGLSELRILEKRLRPLLSGPCGCQQFN